MEPNKWQAMLARLAEPFQPGDVEWKPQATTKDKKRCMAVAYVEAQPYQARLDSVCPEWEDDYQITIVPGAGTKTGKVFVKCSVTLRIWDADNAVSYTQITRSDVGECELDDPNAVTSAKAQAFKRACAAFGLGRYLYDMPKQWVDYDDDRNQITPQALAQLNAMIARKQNNQPAGSAAQVGPGQKPPLEPGGNGGTGQQGSGNGNNRPDWCEQHKQAMVAGQKDGQTFYYHRLPNGDFCNGKEIRKPAKAGSAAGQPASA